MARLPPSFCRRSYCFTLHCGPYLVLPRSATLVVLHHAVVPVRHVVVPDAIVPVLHAFVSTRMSAARRVMARCLGVSASNRSAMHPSTAFSLCSSHADRWDPLASNAAIEYICTSNWHALTKYAHTKNKYSFMLVSSSLPPAMERPVPSSGPLDRNGTGTGHSAQVLSSLTARQSAILDFLEPKWLRY